MVRHENVFDIPCIIRYNDVQLGMSTRKDYEVMAVDFVTAKEKALEWNISLRRVQTYCEQNRINGI